MNTGSVESYLTDGCGRCDKYQTPDCKVLTWMEPLMALRKLLKTTELGEQLKWGSPTYTVDGKNVLMLTCFKDFACITFFQGSLLDDPEGRLDKAGPNSQAGRLMKFTSAEQVHRDEEQLLAFVARATELKRSGAKVVIDRSAEPMPDELQDALDADPDLQAAFDALTPGRQRSHILHVGGAKQSATRARRAQKCIPKILAGKGFLDR